jgi:hypothetical protein
MTLIDKIIASGVLITLLLTSGGIIYKTQTDRIGVLEAQAATIQTERAKDQVTLAEIRLELKYARLTMERMESKLDTLILPPARPTPPPPRLYSTPQLPLQGP